MAELIVKYHFSARMI